MTVPVPPLDPLPTTPPPPQNPAGSPTATMQTTAAPQPTVRPATTIPTPKVTAPTISSQQQPTVAGQVFGSVGSLQGGTPRLTDSIGGEGGALQDYMNPYLETVMQDGLSELQRQYAINRQQGAAGAHMAGAFGDARHGVWEGEAERNFNTQAQQFINQVLSQGYDTAQNLRNTDINRLMSGRQFDIGNEMTGRMSDVEQAFQSALTNAGFDMQRLTQNQQAELQAALTNAGYDMQGLLSAPGLEGQSIDNELAIINAMLGIGDRQQSQQQTSANLAYMDFLRQQGWPQEQLNVFSQILGAMPGMGGTTTQSQQQQSNPLGAIVSMLSLIPSIMSI